MRNLTDVFLESAPSRFKLTFGISKNVMLKSVDNDVRRDKNGVKFNKNCYITFAAVDVEDDNKITAQSTFSYFNIDKPAFATKNFIHQFNQLIEIAQAVVPKDDIRKVLNSLQKVLAEDVDLFKEIKGPKEPSSKLTKSIGELQTKVVDAFIEAIHPYTSEGEGKGDLVNIVVVTDPKGMFLDLPREDKGFISKSVGGRELHIDAKYARWYAEKDKPETATSEDLGDDNIIDEDEIMVEEDDLDGI
jgi:hypothetical protein